MLEEALFRIITRSVRDLWQSPYKIPVKILYEFLHTYREFFQSLFEIFDEWINGNDPYVFLYRFLFSSGRYSLQHFWWILEKILVWICYVKFYGKQVIKHYNYNIFCYFLRPGTAIAFLCCKISSACNLYSRKSDMRLNKSSGEMISQNGIVK